MGVEASRPEPGRTIQVIGAGLPRTGTASLSQALAILLKGPVFHGGSQATQGPERIIRASTKLMLAAPHDTPANQATIKQLLPALLDGYVATTDCPTNCFIAELMDLYPDAKVICTVRDPDDWARSLDETERQASSTSPYFLPFALFWVSPVRLFPAYADALRYGRYAELAGPDVVGGPHRPGWEKYMKYIRETVPADKLVYFDVRDGWEPLCKALDCDVPDVPFPKTNDGQVIARLAKELVTKGLMRWAVVGCVVGVAIGAGVFRWRRV